MSSVFDIITFSCFYSAFAFIVIVWFCKHNKIPNKFLSVFVAAAFFRLVLTYYYYFYTLHVPADAKKYFSYAMNSGFNIDNFLKPGTSFISNLTALFYLPVSVFNDPYLMLYLPYSILGFTGSLLFYKVLKEHTTLNHIEIVILSFFLPNLIFWTGNLGKDSVSFFALMVILSSILDKKIHQRLIFIILGGSLLYLTRPHILFFLFISFGLGLIVDRNKFSVQSMVVLLIVTIGFFLTYQMIFAFLGISLPTESDDNQVSSVYGQAITFIGDRGENLSTGGAATEVSPFKFAFAPFYSFYFLCAPFLWQVRKAIHLLGAVESLIYQYNFGYLLINYKMFIKNKTLQFKNSWLVFIMISSTIMGATYTNFGLTTRQRCMVIPFVVLLYAMVRSSKQNEKLTLKERKEYLKKGKVNPVTQAGLAKE